MQVKNWLNKKLWEKQKVLQEKDEILFDSAVNIYKAWWYNHWLWYN